MAACSVLEIRQIFASYNNSKGNADTEQVMRRWLIMPAVAEGRIGLKSMSGYGGVTFGNALMDKEFRVLAVSK